MSQTFPAGIGDSCQSQWGLCRILSFLPIRPESSSSDSRQPLRLQASARLHRRTYWSCHTFLCRKWNWIVRSLQSADSSDQWTPNYTCQLAIPASFRIAWLTFRDAIANCSHWLSKADSSWWTRMAHIRIDWRCSSIPTDQSRHLATNQYTQTDPSQSSTAAYPIRTAATISL